ncbi:unnamed protein product [Zymoseptoria tritici ST99CH_3D7]|uniref:Uncharacterized protein n=1 Tax=Zymoseptoria tritici (strain ST99CH_3D7) TaxID=1276538 RepID=A0A1X7S7I6_ZYMT9|nr:unnamed protein product [Zymoseptoria tritici ST99CH_3D7]
MAFDEDSGLVYSETTMSTKSMHKQLLPVYSEAQPRPKPRPNRHGSGSRFLFDMTMLSLLRNLDSLSASSLENVPNPVLECTWKAIQENKLDSARTWALFAPLILHGKSRTRSIEAIRPHPRLVFPMLSSPMCDWLVGLTLQDISLTTDLLLSVSQLPNISFFAILGKLDDSEDLGLSDRIVRSWADDAATHRGFSKLESIRLVHQNRVTEASLRYLNTFPQLRDFCVSIPGMSPEVWSAVGETQGWMDHDKSGTVSRRCFWQDYLKLDGRMSQRSNKCSSRDYRSRAPHLNEGPSDSSLNTFLSDWVPRTLEDEHSPMVRLRLSDPPLRSPEYGGREPPFLTTCTHHFRKQMGKAIVPPPGNTATAASKKRRFRDSKSQSLNNVLAGM